MRIVFTGGGTGGHFYPIIAIAEEIHRLVREKKYLDPELYYLATEVYDEHALFENGIKFRQVPAGKLRHYFSISNFFDLFKTAGGILNALFKVYQIYPDVVFGKGGYSSFPSLLAAKILRIPVVIHESDSVPGRVNIWAGKFATRIATSYQEAADYFPETKTACTGNPVRLAVRTPLETGAHEFLKLDKNVPTILVLGGSLGSEKMNDAVVDILLELVEKYQVIHQTGKANLKEIEATSRIILEKSPFKDRYKPFDYLNDLAMRMSAGAASLVISRAGSTIFEIAGWGVPSIMVPIAESNGNHQVENAFNYARSGACLVIQEDNLAPHILLSEIDQLMDDVGKRQEMAKKAKTFSRPDAATKIAEEILNIALEHEK